ncbi:Xylose isomerase [Armadillidium nasatum]|uniref:Xylose isomerase n=1 Tax=Armadillidium nasatum TaxID=96803 RepID=A0A5N5SUB5_9CRUS|nr:Xylose isomerase [Armadillidium nasatum]
MSSPTKKARNNPTEEEYFPSIGKIPFKPDAKPGDTLVFKYYNPSTVIMGKTMEEWLRFSVCFWHTFRGVGLDPFGEATIIRPWDDGSQSLSNAKRRIRAAFEFFSKLGLYMNGAATNSNAHVTAYAGAQLKKGLEIAKRLGAENFVFWGGREGYQSLLNADVKSELDHLAAFFKMAVAFKKKIGFKGVFLIEPKPKEPTRHQYDFDAQTVMAFLHNYALYDEFKLNIEPNHTMLAGHPYEHDVVMASIYGMLGSIDANTGSPDLGWDTDQFPMDVRNTTLVMKAVIEQGGIAPGGLNFDAKVRRESTALEDMFIAHIGAMDTFARGLQNASQLITDGILKKALQQRYKSWSSGIGSKIASGEATLEDCESYIKKHGNPTPDSARQEHFESVLNFYV